MKNKYSIVELLIVICLIFTMLGATGCTSTDPTTGKTKLVPPTQAQVAAGVTDALQLTAFGLQVYSQMSQVKSGAIPKSDVPSLVYADMSGAGAILQSAVGSGMTPTQAVLASTSAAPIPGTFNNQTQLLQVVSALPQKPVTQATVNTVFNAAAAVPVAGMPSSMRAERRKMIAKHVSPAFMRTLYTADNQPVVPFTY